MPCFREMEEEEPDVIEYEDDYEEDIDEEEGGAEVEAIHSDSSADDDLEPDSLAEGGRVRQGPGTAAGEESSDSDTVQISGGEEDDDDESDEIGEVFSRDANSNPVSRTAVSVGGSRAESIMSRSSISYFVDLQERDASSSPLDSPSATGVMSQSMYAARSASGSNGESQQGSVSFFVDISKSNSKPQPQPKRRQSLGGGNPSSEPIVAVITRAREHLKSALSGPTLTKAEVRRKRSAVNKIEALLSEEESRLRRGEEPSNGNVVDVVLMCGSADQSTTGGGGLNKSHQNPLEEDPKQRPLSAYQQQRHGSISTSGGGNQVRGETTFWFLSSIRV